MSTPAASTRIDTGEPLPDIRRVVIERVLEAADKMLFHATYEGETGHPALGPAVELHKLAASLAETVEEGK